MTQITRYEKTNCPGCCEACDSATHLTHGDIRPKEGDLSLCFYCGVLLWFVNATGDRRRLSRQEYEGLELSLQTELTTLRRQMTFRHVLLFDWRFVHDLK